MNRDRKHFPIRRDKLERWTVQLGLLAAIAVGPASLFASQASPTGSAGATTPAEPNKAQAYYHYTLGHLYQEQGRILQRSDLLAKAIDELRLALQNDPGSSFLSMELADLYAATGRWRSALQEMEDAIQRNPQDAAVRKLLGRLYLRLLSGSGREQAPPELQQRAIKAFEEIVQKDSQDLESLLTLAQLYRATQNNTKAEELLKKALELRPDSQEANVQLALFYVDIGDYRSAVKLLEKAVANDSTNSQLFVTLAYAHEQLRDYKEAAEAYRQALALEPGKLEFRKALGQALLSGQQYDQALEQFQVVAEANPQDPETLLRLSQIYRFQRKYEMARQNLAKAAEIAPESLEVQYNTVLLAESEGNPQEAVRATEKILGSTVKADPTLYTAQEKANRGVFLEKLGSLHRDQQDFEAAINAFAQMRELGGDSAVRGELRLIEIYQEEREYDKALEASEKAVKQYPENQEVAMARASLLASMGDVEAAAAVLKPLLKNEPDDREVWLGLAQVYLRARQFGPAQEALSKAGELSQTEDEKAYDHFLAGSIWERQKEFDRAAAEFRRALEINPNSAMILNYLGYMFADQGIYLDEAIGYIERALEMEPNSGAYLDSLGWAYFRQDRLDVAEEYLRKAVGRIPTDPTIRAHLGDVYYKAGRIREAQQEWKIALQEWRRLPKNELDPEEVAGVERKLQEANIKLAQQEKQESSRP
ncbi:MAG: tetratricopeptide repeat protein [Acidobacteria bacterium]|nr:tetratricopeptide repeat protein [Acidobacteriota bacterium]